MPRYLSRVDSYRCLTQPPSGTQQKAAEMTSVTPNRGQLALKYKHNSVM